MGMLICRILNSNYFLEMYSAERQNIFSMVSFDRSNGKFKHGHFVDNSVAAFLQMMMMSF